MSGKRKRRLVLFLRGWVGSLLIALLIAASFKSAVADWNDVPTGSMVPTILEGDRIFINKLAYDLKLPFTTWHIARWDNPKRGDIVVFFSPADGKRLVKRVIGLPGDVISMRNNQLYINGKAVKYETINPKILDYIQPESHSRQIFFNEHISGKKHPVMFTPAHPSLHSFFPIKVPQGRYFLMGDNRDNSADSRFFGFVERTQIIGRAVAIVISRDASFLHPRWNRFFQKLS